MKSNSLINVFLRSKHSSKFVCVLLCLLFVFPKILLVKYTNTALWGTFDYLTSFDVVLQDTLLAVIYFFVLRWAYLKNKASILFIVFLFSGLLLACLLIDVRVRELWLRPIDLDLIRYSISNYKDLVSGTDVFLKYTAGFGITFRRILFMVGVMFSILFFVLFYLQKTELRSELIKVVNKKQRLTVVAKVFVVVVLFFSTVNAGNLAYNIEKNLIISPFVNAFKKQIDVREGDDELAFEQPLAPLSNPEALTANASIIKPFNNVIILILESVRFKEFGELAGNNGEDFHMPFLERLGSEGFMQKCYVSVPHTSKSQFAILSGRNPLAAIEMRESMVGKVPSIVSLLKETKGAASHFITVQNLNFENTSGMLNALGFEHIVGPGELGRYGEVNESSSFGFFDDAFLNFPYDEIKQSEPFVLTFMTNAAHYPYDYPGKKKLDDISYAAYLKSEEATDKIVKKLFDKLLKSKLLDNTLVVIVGDHGESFGEHGTFIHNSSMYDEEVTVPLIFWSADGRLKDIPLRKQTRQIDIAPTIADLLGVHENDNYILQGESLIKRNDLEPPIFISTFFSGISQAIVDDGRKVMLSNGEGKVTVYDLDKDPAELNGKVVNGLEREQYMLRFRQYTNYHEKVFEGVRWD